MPTHSIGKDAPKTSLAPIDLEPTTFRSLREVLSDQMILDACHAADYHFRRRVLTPVVTVLHMVFTAVWPKESFASSWRQLWVQAVGRDTDHAGQSPSPGSRSKARGRLPLNVWRRLFEALVKRLQPLCERWARWRGHRVVLADGTCVSMSDTPALHQAFGTNIGPKTHGRFPLARLVAVSLAETMTVLGYALGAYRQDENVLLQPLLQTLLPGDLLIADRHFAGAHLYVRYQKAGLEFLTRVHQCLNVFTLRKLVVFSQDDFLARMHVGKSYRQKDPSLPAWLPVRMLRASLRIRGRYEKIWFATSLLDPQQYPAAEIIELYARRWRIETLLRELKVALSADVLRSQTPDGVRKEVAARMLALNSVRYVMLQAAEIHGVDPLRQSFAGAVDVLLAFAPLIGVSPPQRLPALRHAMLKEIASRLNPLRPVRQEPRAIRREVKHYPSLKITRAQWRKQHAA